MMTKTRLSSDKTFFIAACILCLISCIMLAITFIQRHDDGVFAGIPSSHVVTQGSAKVAISSIRRESGTGHYVAPKGKHYVVLTLTVTNTTDTPITIAPSNDTYMKNSLGDVVYLTPLELANPFHSGQLLPHETVRGELSYLVKDADTHKYYLESDWTGGVVMFSLQ